METKTRKNILLSLLKKYKLDLILVYSDSHNFKFDSALNKIKPVLFHYYYMAEKKEGFLEIDYLVEEIKDKIKGLEVVPISEHFPNEEFSLFLKKYKRIGIVGEAPWAHLKDVKSKLVNLTEEAEKILLQKNKEEIEKINISAKIVSKILKNLKPRKMKGKSEKEIEKILTKEFMKSAEGLAFPICITSGDKIKDTTASLPSKRVILKKDIVAIDAGVIKGGFYSDCTRMYFLKNKEAENNYKKLKSAQKRIILKIIPRMKIGQLRDLVKEEIKRENLPSETLEEQDLGHSIGFYFHEEPIFLTKENENFELKENMIITLEPEISFKDYRLRVEDMVLVGNPSRRLTEE